MKCNNPFQAQSVFLLVWRPLNLKAKLSVLHTHTHKHTHAEMNAWQSQNIIILTFRKQRNRTYASAHLNPEVLPSAISKGSPPVCGFCLYPLTGSFFFFFFPFPSATVTENKTPQLCQPRSCSHKLLCTKVIFSLIRSKASSVHTCGRFGSTLLANA